MGSSFGNVWLFLVLSGSVCLFLVCGMYWWFLVVHGGSWQFLVVIILFLVVLDGSEWLLMVFGCS